MSPSRHQGMLGATTWHAEVTSHGRGVLRATAGFCRGWSLVGGNKAASGEMQ